MNILQNLSNTFSSFLGSGQPQRQPKQENVAKLASDFANWTKERAQQGIKIIGNVPTMITNPYTPLQNSIANSPEWIQRNVTQPVQKAIPGNGFLQNAARDTVGMIGGIASLPGIAQQTAQKPVETLSHVAGGIVDSYKKDIGFDDQNQWKAQNIATNFYERPVSTTLDFLPVVGMLGKAGTLGKAGRAGKLAETTSFVDDLDNFQSPRTQAIVRQPGKSVLNDVFSDLQQKTAAVTQTRPALAGTTVENVVKQSPIANKVTLLDYFRTPENVLNKIGLGNEAKQLRTAWDSYLSELPQEIDRITEWSKRVPQHENTNLFRYLDGKQVTLSPQTMQIAQEIRQYLTTWAERLKLPEENRISNYITHIFERGSVPGEFDADLAKLIRGKVPGGVYDPFLLQRQGKIGYIEDTWRALDAYVKRATRKSNLDPVLEKISFRADSLDESQYAYLKNYIDRVNMRPTDIDLLLDNTIRQSPIGDRFGARPTTVLTQKARQMVYRGALGLNLRSALTNLTQGVNTYSQLGEKYTIIGYSKIVQNLPKLLSGAKTELDEVGLLRDSFVQDRQLSATKTAMQTLDKGLFYMFENAEKINRGAAYFGAKAKAKAMGFSDSQAIEYAKNTVRKTQFSFGAIDTPVALQSDIAKTLFQFQNYSVKQMEYLGGMAKAKDVAGLTRYIAGTLAIVYGIGQLWDMKPQDMIPSLRLGVPPTLQLPYGIGQAAIQQVDKYGNPLTIQERLLNKNVVSGIANYFPGGQQLKKTGSNILQNMQGGSYTNAGNLRYPASNEITGYLFGPSYTDNAQEYRAQDYRPLSESETKQFKLMLAGGMEGQQAYNLIRSDQAKEQEFDQFLQNAQQPQPQSIVEQIFSAIGLGQPKPASSSLVEPGTTGDILLDELNKGRTEDNQAREIKQIFESGMTPEQIQQALGIRGYDIEEAREIMIKSLEIEPRSRVLQSVLSQAGPLWLEMIHELTRKDILTTGIVDQWLEAGTISEEMAKQIRNEIKYAKGTAGKNYVSGYGYTNTAKVPSFTPRINTGAQMTSTRTPQVEVPSLKPVNLDFSQQTERLENLQNVLPTGKPNPNPSQRPQLAYNTLLDRYIFGKLQTY